MNENDKQRYSAEDVTLITQRAQEMHETIKRIANAWVSQWLGGQESVPANDAMARIDLENMQNAAGLMLAVCTCVDASLVKQLTGVIGATVAARVKVDFKRVEPQAPPSDTSGG